MLSVRNKKYDILKIENSFLKEDLEIPQDVANIIISRIKKEAISEYLSPKINLPNIESILDMQKAIDRTKKAIINNETIAILGDYDVDGACASALMINFLKNHNIKTHVYIPDRLKEGYGPNHKAFEFFKEKKCTLIFTLDCGTASKNIFDEHSDLDIIVIDHHLPPKELPEVLAIVNAQIDPQIRSDLKYLCAGGMVFLFLIALNKILDKKVNLTRYLDLVALSTVCDVMTLKGLNRAFVKEGLKICENTDNLGLKTLAEVSNIDNISTTYDCGFVIGPRINAGGRVHSSYFGVELLTTSDLKKAEKISCQLDSLNAIRRDIENKLVEESINFIESKKFYDNPCLLVGEKNWHPGVVGIVASRLKDIYNKPALVFGTNDENISIGSARSVGNIDIGTILSNATDKKIILSGGGHAKAGGFKFDQKNLNNFYEFLNNEVSKYPDLQFDDLINLKRPLSGITYDLFEHFNYLKPYGPGNSEPLVCVENCRVHPIKLLKEKHMQCFLIDDLGKRLRAICFNAIRLNLYDALKSNKKFNVLGHIKKGYYKKTIDFHVQDLIAC